MHKGIVILAASVGGPPLINEVLSSLPERFGFPVLVLQFMESDFSEPLTAAWSKTSVLSLKRLTQEEKVQGGCAYVIPFNMYAVFEKNGQGMSVKPREIESECDAGYQWSRVIDECVKYYDQKTILVLLADYGIQGGSFRRSLKNLRNAGGSIICRLSANGREDGSAGTKIEGEGWLEMEIDQIVSHLQRLSEAMHFEPKKL